MKKRKFNKIGSSFNNFGSTRSAPPPKNDSDSCQVTCVHEDAVQTALNTLPAVELREDIAAFFRNFGDPTRLTIIASLLPGELCVCDIAAVVGMSVSAVSHQLRVLRQAKIVRSRRDGKQVFYSIDDEHVGLVLSLARTHLEEER
ncbi:MAG TPA: metalloregulator ArsR/SmtB family transcription factor [Treponemataceae bacterium]|nr:metalloregulator ArsR/SmtB family transcription factor [Treponemataceae bacterium]